MTYRDILNIAIKRLYEANVPEPEPDAFMLFQHIYGMTRNDLLLKGDLEAPETSKYLDVIDIRARRIPLQYITGSQNFYGLDFKVSRGTLIPRFDTEVLVDWILGSEKAKQLSVLDMCTGTGCIILSLAYKRNSWKCTGTDISDDALSVARENRDNIMPTVDIIKSDLFENVSDKYDLIVSNPPYIQTSVINELMEEVKDNEPLIALDGGQDGLDFYRRIADEARYHLNDNGRLYFEIGYDEGEAVRELLSDYGYLEIEIKNDLAGLPRCVRAVCSSGRNK